MRSARRSSRGVIDTPRRRSRADEVDLAEVASTVVTRTQLEAYVAKLADPGESARWTMPGLLGFMASSFTLNIETRPICEEFRGSSSVPKPGASVFPVFDGLSLTIPDPGRRPPEPKPVTFETYATAHLGFIARTVASYLRGKVGGADRSAETKSARSALQGPPVG